MRPEFHAVRTGDEQHLDVVTAGNEHVIRARFADADFFIREDLKEALEDFLPRLSTLTFQVSLGSMLDKTRRIVLLSEQIGDWLSLKEDQQALVSRTAELCKADLATQMVVEMTSLQGVMGRYYAIDSGEPEEVALGIYEHYLPRHAGDSLPEGIPGLVVGLADRLDTLVGLFAADLVPSGNRDPFGQRRAALGLVANLIERKLDLDLRRAIEAAGSNLPIPSSAESQERVLEFIIERLRGALREQGAEYDVVDAVLGAQGHYPARAAAGVHSLSSWVERPDWAEILPAYARCVRITRDVEQRYPVEEGLFIEPAEVELYRALSQAEETPRSPGSVDDFLTAFLPMIPAINRFFDKVLVMSEDVELRENRLGVLQRIVELSSGVADMSKLEGF
jgi:glycyl-tRNA synthetase